MDEAELDECRRFAFEAWGLEGDQMDAVDIFHALRILRLKAERPIPTFDDYWTAYRKLMK